MNNNIDYLLRVGFELKASDIHLTVGVPPVMRINGDLKRYGKNNLAPNDTAKKAAQDALNGWDPSQGAIYYYNPNTATSAWIWSRPQTVQIGNHKFCK